MGVILLTGFEPFLEHPVNSSWEGVRVLDGRALAGREIVARRLPVSFRRARPLMLRWLEELRPDLVIAFGLAPEGRIRLEQVALNVNHTDRPDNDGRKLHDRRIEPGGALALPSRLPLPAIERVLRRGGIPVRRSFHAGTYLCNNIFYTLLVHSAAPAGFVHVPPLPSRGRRTGAMGLARLRRAIRLVVEAAARTLAGRRASR